MSEDKCLHEDTLSYGLTVYQSATMKVIQVMCDGCGAFGTVVETWDDDNLDYVHDSESWHDIRTYRYLIGSELDND